MGENSTIEWCDHTFNPWWGCTKVSPGCQHCFALTFSKRVGRDIWGPTAARWRTGANNWDEPLKWNRQAEAAGQRRRVFCASMADVFEGRNDADAPLGQWRWELWELIQRTPALDWLLLTKRPENVALMAPGTWRTTGLWPRNVWLGASVESQDYAERRIPHILALPAPVRFLSVEPLLGPLDLTPWLGAIQWVIVGGESGPGARPMQPEWVRSLRDQCATAGVAFFFKQWGGHPDKRGHEKAVIDGSEWKQFPEAQPA